VSVIARKKVQAYTEDFRREAVKPADQKGKKKLTKEQKKNKKRTIKLAP